MQNIDCVVTWFINISDEMSSTTAWISSATLSYTLKMVFSTIPVATILQNKNLMHFC